MLLASNRGAGMNIGMPDVCLTPAAPAPVPVPYPNLGLNVQASPFCTLIKITGMPGLNLGSKIPMTMGDEGGTAHPMFKQMGSYTAGNSAIYLEKLPAINLTCPTTGNNMNNAAGAVLVPSVTNVFFTLDRSSLEGPLDAAVAPRDGEPVVAERAADGGVVVRIMRFTTDVARRVFVALERSGLRDGDELIFDLRGCPGGDARAALDLASDLCDAGVVLARFRDTDGDEAVIKSRGPRAYQAAVRVIVDGQTASAAELFAGVMAVSGGAVLEGERTFGKATAQQVLAAPGRGPARYETVGQYLLADGTSFQGDGLAPTATAPRPTAKMT